MFLINSPLGSLAAAPLLGQALSLNYGRCFAEFLKEGSLDHLGTFIPTYQSRFAVRALYFKGNEDFLDGMASTESPCISAQFSPTFSYNIQGGFTCPGITYDG